MASIDVYNTLFTGKFLIHEAWMPSTNEFARELISKTKPLDGTVIITDHQTAGKGQGARSWQAEAGKNITCSIIYDTSFLEARQSYFLNMAAAAGIHDLLSEYFPAEVIKIRWPNDIMCRGRKVAGILIENSVRGSLLIHSVIGIGLNVNQEIFSGLPHATSMLLEAGRSFPVEEIFHRLCLKVEQQFLRLKGSQQEKVREDYNEGLYGKGRMMRWNKKGVEIKAVPLMVNEYGQMIAIAGGQECVFTYGEVRMIYEP